MTEKPWRDKDLVNHLYHDEGMTGGEIANKLGCSVGPIYERIDETRSRSEANKLWQLRKPAQFKTTENGYERVATKIDGKHYSTAVHRLIAVAEHGFDALKGNVVHHKNGVPWDNRPENLELMTQQNHVREHMEETPQYEKTAMWALRETDYTAEDVGKMFGHTRSSVTTVWKRIEDGDYAITEAEA